ncbi:MAG: hypothetical protein JMN27_14765 [gamma proteobacterium endosymbiont of Lamellibrachia anaximandri]|nr:hypothetical protein [gamma proteobacterium endosymbiont of Lamellibrachia anaximandri]MBL3535073.1 hypothetical protein [gamma proteobacterium endosymbiont of Lamellibrachia anaximandri]MBL3599854.1 hypothetical protein [gamma proteobacterium endosymbiont of Lamellibrachia anaximandri]
MNIPYHSTIKFRLIFLVGFAAISAVITAWHQRHAQCQKEYLFAKLTEFEG